MKGRGHRHQPQDDDKVEYDKELATASASGNRRARRKSLLVGLSKTKSTLPPQQSQSQSQQQQSQEHNGSRWLPTKSHNNNRVVAATNTQSSSLLLSGPVSMLSSSPSKITNDGRSGPIKTGKLKKWRSTYYGLSRWEDKYWVVEPGYVKYTDCGGTGAEPKFILLGRSTIRRGKESDTIEISHGRRQILIKADSPKECNDWLKAFYEARQVFDQIKLQKGSPGSTTGSAALDDPNLVGGMSMHNFADVADSNNISDEPEKPLLQTMIDNSSHFRQTSQAIYAELSRIQKRLIDNSAIVKEEGFKGVISGLMHSLVTNLCDLQRAEDIHLTEQGRLISELLVREN